MLAGVLAAPPVAPLLATGSATSEGHAVLLGMGVACALFAWAVYHSRRAGLVLRWHPLLGVAAGAAALYSLAPLVADARVHAALAVTWAGRLLLALGLALQAVRSDVQLEMLGFAAAGGVLAHAGGLAASGLLAGTGVPGYAAVAMPVLIGFRMAATRRLTRDLGVLALVLAAAAAWSERATLVCGGAAAVAMIACGRGGQPRRTPVARGVAFGLVAQVALELAAPALASPAGWTLLAIVAGAAVAARELPLGPSLGWLAMAPLAAWFVLATFYTEARRVVAGYLWHEARRALVRGHAAEAHDLYHQVADARAWDLSTMLESARVCVVARHLDAALSAALRGVELAPSSPAALETLAAVYMARGEFALAVSWLQRLRAVDPDARAVEEQLPLALAGTGDHAAARDGLLALIREKGPTAGRLLALGQATWRAGDRAGGVRAFEKAAKDYPDDPKTHLALAQVHRAGGETARAEASFRRTLELVPRDDAARVQLALMLYQSGRGPEGAALLLEQALIDPRSRELHEGVVHCFPAPEQARVRALPSRTAALELARAEAARGPRAASLERALAMELAQRGDAAGARAALDALVAREPAYAEGWAALAHLRERGGDVAGASQAWQRVLALGPSPAPLSRQAMRQLARIDARKR